MIAIPHSFHHTLWENKREDVGGGEIGEPSTDLCLSPTAGLGWKMEQRYRFFWQLWDEFVK